MSADKRFHEYVMPTPPVEPATGLLRIGQLRKISAFFPNKQFYTKICEGKKVFVNLRSL